MKGLKEDNDDDLDDVDLEQESKEKLKKLAGKKNEQKRKRERKEKGDDQTKKRRRGKKDIANEEGEEGEEPPFQETPKKEKHFFDQMIEDMKGGKKRKKLTELEIAEQITMIEGFRVRMDMAAEDDRTANLNKKPALSKLMMLSEVLSQLEKRNMHQAFIENDLLLSIKRWLEPLPDKSLPNMKIREGLLNTLLKFPRIETEDLKDSGIGKVIMYLSKHPNETLPNKKVAKTLIERWSRPIFGISEQYSDLASVEEDSYEKNISAKRELTSSGNIDLTSELEKKRNLEAQSKITKDSPTYHARIPERLALDFKIRPKSKISMEDAKKKTKRVIEKNLMNKKSIGDSARGQIKRAVGISVEGRHISH